MLFLALLSGLLAPYKLEQTIERYQGHLFEESLSNNLIADINHPDNIIDHKNNRPVELDS